ncbi:hypothetical protein [Bacillus phage vB_BceS-M2]
MIGLNPFSDFHKPSSYVKKRYWLIGFPLIGILVIVVFTFMIVTDAVSRVIPKWIKRRLRK